MIEHENMVKKLVKPGEEILAQVTPFDMHLIHMAMGICGEAGELLDAIKKRSIYNKPLDYENVIEELGDIEFYLEGIRQALFVRRKTCLEANIKKLGIRYKDHLYSDQQAQDRLDKA